MNNFIFENTTKVYFGEGCVKEYLRCLTKHYGDTILLAYGGGSVKTNRVYEEVTDLLTEAGKEIIEFAGIMSNPTYEKVLEGVRLARENNVGMILGIGGEAVIDCCKVVSVAARYNGDVWANFWARPGIIDFEPLPVGVIVTVAGSGSECNGGAVITNEALQVKMGRDYPGCSPKFALLDPTYTYGISKSQMVSGGFDTFSHMMEIYFCKPDEDNVSDDIAEALMKNVIRNLRAAIADPQDYTARSNLMWDAVMAGNKIIKLGKQTDFVCHQTEHQIGAHADCDCGVGSTSLCPEYYRHIYKERLNKFKRFATNIWGVDARGKSEEEAALAGIEALENFMTEIGIPVTLREPETDEEIIAK